MILNIYESLPHMETILQPIKDKGELGDSQNKLSHPFRKRILAK
jgi:hypothetical protein